MFGFENILQNLNKNANTSRQIKTEHLSSSGLYQRVMLRVLLGLAE
jgi:hypothetical protein